MGGPRPGDGDSETGAEGDGDTDGDTDADSDFDVVVDADRETPVDADRDETIEADLDVEADSDQQPLDADPDVTPDADEEAPSLCPPEMVELETSCMDRYEAPNRPGALPLVMYTFLDSAAWCEARGKRLCFDDEWQSACEGPAALRYPYGDDHHPGVCNDDHLWRTYNQSLLNGWPNAASNPEIESLAELFAAASSTSPAAADHVEWLYQGEPGGENEGCVGPAGVYDLVGNVEEWTRRRDGGSRDFHGALKGRYWAESRTCQSRVTTHGDAFRFYEIGFRCCLDIE
jgi:formylglycine-generating enzyme required for sulfatase activity